MGRRWGHGGCCWHACLLRCTALLCMLLNAVFIAVACTMQPACSVWVFCTQRFLNAFSQCSECCWAFRAPVPVAPPDAPPASPPAPPLSLLPPDAVCPDQKSGHTHAQPRAIQDCGLAIQGTCQSTTCEFSALTGAPAAQPGCAVPACCNKVGSPCSTAASLPALPSVVNKQI